MSSDFIYIKLLFSEVSTILIKLSLPIDQFILIFLTVECSSGFHCFLFSAEICFKLFNIFLYFKSILRGKESNGNSSEINLKYACSEK